MNSNRKNNLQRPQECSIISALNVDVNELNTVLDRITKAISRHEKLFRKVSEIEEKQLQIQKSFSLFRLNASSQKSFEAAGIFDSADDHCSKTLHCEESESKENAFNGDDSDPATFMIEKSEGLSRRRLQAVSNAVQKVEKSMTNSTLSDLRKDIVGLKAIVSHIQQELNFEIAHSSEIECRVDGLRSTMTSIENEHGNGAIATTIQHQREFVLTKVDGLLTTINEVELSTKNAVESKMNEKLSEMKNCFTNLESSVHDRQSQMTRKLSLLAKASDLSALEENVSNELHDYKSRIGVLENSVLSNEDALLQMRQHASFLSFQKVRNRWQERIVKTVWNRWKIQIKFLVNEEKTDIQRKKNIRKLLIRNWLARKSNAWKKWQHFILSHRNLESTRNVAIRNVIERMLLKISLPCQLAFNKWRRVYITTTIQQKRVDLIESCDQDSIYTAATSKLSTIGDYASTDSISNQYDLSALLESFCTDKDGAIQTLAQEIKNIKAIDIQKARRDMESRIEMAESRFDENLLAQVSHLQIKDSVIEGKLDEKFDSLFSQLPKMKSEIAEMRNSLCGTINRVKIIEQTHRDRIELLFEGKESIEEEMTSLKKDLSSTQSRLNILEYNNDRSQNTINTMLQNILSLETFCKGHQKTLDAQMAELNDTLQEVIQDVIQTKKHNDEFNDAWIETRNNIIQSKVNTETAFKELHGILGAHGISQPKWRDIIEHGGLFESKSKEKNYVVPINFSVESRAHIDIPGDIAAFAHDYAAWIAFEADRDALKIVVIGKNPEDKGCIEDNTEVLRTTFVERFKKSLEESLDDAFPNAGAIRLEARMIYVARVVDAINAALSKHDQVIIPASTRLGRVQAVVPTCMACDRPLTRKGRKRPPGEDEVANSGAGKLDVKPSHRSKTPVHGRGVPPNNAAKAYILRGGFKMPASLI